MDLIRRVKENEQAIRTLARERGVASVRVFGSVAREDEHQSSDLDLLIELAPDRSLIDHVAFKQDVEDLLGCRVDVVTEKSLHPMIREKIVKEARPL